MKLVLFGAANPETARMIKSVESQKLKVIGFLDNNPAKEGTIFCGLPVLGNIDKVAELSQDSDVHFVNLITGSTKARYEVSRDIHSRGGRFGKFIHSSVNTDMVKIGLGTYVQEAVVLQAEVELGHNSSIHTNTVIGHESKIGNSVFIAHMVSVSGCCEIGDGTFIGTNATILPRVKIGKWVTIGAGAVINKDVPDYSVVVGNPGRILKNNDINYQHADIFV